MPCYIPAKKEIDESQANHNYEKYGFKLPDNALIAHLLNMCCEMGGELEAEGIEDRLSRGTYDWYMNHKKRDNEKRKAEIQDRLQKLKKEEKNVARKLNEIDDEISKLQGQLASI